MKTFIRITALLGAATIALGAFGAHGLGDVLNASQLQSYETAVRYQLYHVLALLIVNATDLFNLKSKKIISYLFLAGILFFSGSIYAIVFGTPVKYIWFVTPLGGLLFIIGWLTMFFSSISTSK